MGVSVSVSVWGGDKEGIRRNKKKKSAREASTLPSAIWPYDRARRAPRYLHPCLLKCDALLHKLKADGFRHVERVGSKNAWPLDGRMALQHKARCNTAWHTDQFGHGRRAVRHTIVKERRGECLVLAVLGEHTEAVLEHDHVALTRFVGALALQIHAQRVEQVARATGELLRQATDLDRLVREQAEPAHAAQDELRIFVVLERTAFTHSTNQGCLVRGARADETCSELRPRQVFGGEPVLRTFIKEAQTHQREHQLWEALVPKRAANALFSLRDAVPLAEWRRIAVRVCDEGKRRHDVVWSSCRHQVEATDGVCLVALDELGRVPQSQQDAARRPRELVAEWVRRSLWRREPAAVREERLDLATCIVDVLDGLDGIQMVKTRVQADFVEHGDASCLNLWLERTDRVGHVRSRDDVDLVLACSLDDIRMVDVRDQRNDQVVLLDGRAERRSILDIDLHRLRAWELLAELRGMACGANRHGELREPKEVLDDRACHVARAQDQHLLWRRVCIAALAIARGDDRAWRRLAIDDNAVRELRQDKRGTVDIVVVVRAVRHRPQRLPHIAVRIQRADDEPDLAAWVRWDQCVRIVGHREQFLRGLRERSDQLQMQPHALALRGNVATWTECLLEQLKVRLLE